MSAAALLCREDGCAFFGTTQNHGKCSAHAVGGHGPRTALTENEILERLGLQREDVFMTEDVVQERCVWLRRYNLPYLHCDDISGAETVLGLPQDETRWLSVDQAVALMNAVDQRHPMRYPRIAIEKAIVRRTFYSTLLPQSVFPVGLCYHGEIVVLHNHSEVDLLRKTVQRLWKPFVSNQERRRIESLALRGGAA